MLTKADNLGWHSGRGQVWVHSAGVQVSASQPHIWRCDQSPRALSISKGRDSVPFIMSMLEASRGMHRNRGALALDLLLDQSYLRGPHLDCNIELAAHETLRSHSLTRACRVRGLMDISTGLDKRQSDITTAISCAQV